MAGRPPYKPTPATRRRVSIAAGAGMSHEEIALALEIDRNTLAKHFAHELTVGAYQRRAEVIEAMHAAAKKGNIAAQKAFLQLTPRAAAPPAPDSEPADKPLGKKAQANVDAQTAHVGTEWSELLRPTAPVQ